MRPMIAILILSMASFAGAEEPFVSKGFLKVPDSVKLGPFSSVDLDSQGNLYVLHRGEPPLLAFNAKLEFIKGFGEGLFKVPHGLRVDKAGTIWTTDNSNNLIRQFSPDGKLLQSLGGPSVAAEQGKFKSPDDLVFDSKGILYVADAGNARIVKLTPEGKVLATWGKKGKGAGEFAIAHSMTIDANDRITIGDRGNNRVQTFDTDGKLLATHTGFGNPYGVLAWDRDLIVAEGDVHKLFVIDPAGKILSSWGGPTSLQLPHLMARRGNTLYVTEVNGKRVQILEKK